MHKPFDIQPTIFKATSAPIRVLPYDENALNPEIMADFLESSEDGAFGLAPGYNSKCQLSILAISSLTQVLLVKFSLLGTKKKRNAAPSGRALIAEYVLSPSISTKYAFKMDKLAASLYLDMQFRISAGIDLLSSTTSARQSLQAFMTAIGGEVTLDKQVAERLFKGGESMDVPVADIALQAWAACKTATLPSTAKILASRPRINTSIMKEDHLRVLSKILRDAERLVSLKPVRVKNDVETTFNQKNGNLNLTSVRYKTKIMRTSASQTIEVEMDCKGKNAVLKGRAIAVEGRAASIQLQGSMGGKAIRSVYTVGREEPTSAEGQRSMIILRAFQRSNDILQHPFFKAIWLPSESPSWNALSWEALPIHFLQRLPNASQKKAISSILSVGAEDCISVIQGPPGTGKTTVIAAAVTSMASSTRTLWLVAQSNVAVKNIAEKLADVGHFDFKILVSKDFHFDWHEHLYGKITRNVVRSDTFPKDTISAQRLLLDSKVILCTLSMMSNDHISAFTRVVPVETVIVDEASQIEVGDYIPLLHRYKPTLRKLVFIGDDEQLPPYGKDDIEDLESVFEKKHLRKRAVFLDTQYRMPVPIGTFISQSVYNNKLKTIHKINSPSSCRFVDVRRSCEQNVAGSFKNEQELRVAMQIVRKYVEKGKSWRFVTPYDGQRTEMERMLRSAGLPWEDKCFNVDSFQGNEEDHIIISVVRSAKPGFLTKKRRANVMLSRCKQSMVICSSRSFANGVAKKTLIGKLSKHLGPQSWIEGDVILSGRNF